MIYYNISWLKIKSKKFVSNQLPGTLNKTKVYFAS